VQVQCAACRRVRHSLKADDGVNLADGDAVLASPAANAAFAVNRQNRRCAAPESNWLLAPSGKAFSLTIRTYVPKDVVKRGEWFPPAVKRLK
jgi:hypothetical protein